MKVITSFLTLLSATMIAHALVINEVMSNPVGDDSGREWIEIYNNSDNDIDVSSLTISIKGGTFVSIVPVSGGIMLMHRGYAIIGSTVSGTTKFSQDYPSYSGQLFRSSISLVNTGTTSLEIKLLSLGGDIVSSYTAAKEGSTYSLVNGVFVQGAPTPGEENKAFTTEDSSTALSTSTLSVSQLTIAQAPPVADDIVIYLPNERVVVAGAPSLFSAYGLTHGGRYIENIMYSWAFGDGGRKSGSSTPYTYYYPGNYIATVEGTNGYIQGKGLIRVRVLAPDIAISPLGYGKYGAYIDITNPNTYNLDISEWKLLIDGAGFPFPKNTIIGTGVTRFSGLAMGFASTTISSSTVLKILFPTMEEVVQVHQTNEDALLQTNMHQENVAVQSGIVRTKEENKQINTFLVNTNNPVKPQSSKISKSTTTDLVQSASGTTTSSINQKDTRVARWIKGFFSGW